MAMEFEATRKMVIGGVLYSPGDVVDVSKFPTRKVHQFLDKGILRPKPS